jgi:mannose-6-phosphate isomerase-like protein (cupin superfamily)
VEVDLRRLLRSAAEGPDRHRRVALDNAVNLAEKLASFDELFAPKIVGYYNGHKIQVGKIKGEFVWHSHPDTDDFFLILKGRLTIQLRDRDVELGEGDLFVVPRGLEHCPVADEETHLLLIEAKGARNVGDADAEAAPEVEI